MRYLFTRHGTFWFQIRVPKTLVPRYGTHIRQNLGLTDRALAQALAFQLASQWLARFAFEKTAPLDQDPVAPLPHTQNAPFLYGDDLSDSLRQSPLAEQTPDQTRHTASLLNTSGIGDSFDGLLRYWRKLHPECSPSTYKEVTAVVKHAKSTLRKRPSELRRTDIAAYRDRLIASRLARATVAKKISFISALLQTAYDAGALSQNVARGLRIPKSKVALCNRRAFVAAELAWIFSSPVYRVRKRYRAGGGEAAAWLPLIALATGARLEEISQLRAVDLFIDDTHGPLIRISDEGVGQRVKTSSSRRIIPVHPELVEAGLLEYWESVMENGHEWLFPDLEPDHDGRRGGTWGQWFSRYLRSRNGCGINDRRLVFHSFRHSFKTLCREAGLSEEIHDALTGHASSSVGRSYGHVPTSSLVTAINQLRFPVSFPTIIEGGEE